MSCDSTEASAGQKGSEPSLARLATKTDICTFYATNANSNHYFEIVYVKVIFLHVDCCYFVFRSNIVSVSLSFFPSFFVKRRKSNSNSVCRKKRVTFEIVVRSKSFGFISLKEKKHCLYFWEHFFCLEKENRRLGNKGI